MNYSLHFFEKAGLYDGLNALLLRHIPAPIEILYTPNGKPYIEGNPLYFSLSHSGNRAVAAVSKYPLGVDFEVFTGKQRSAVINRFSAREQGEIVTEGDFLRHWTAREAFIKLKGLTLASTLKHLEFTGERLYFMGEGQPVKFDFYEKEGGVIAVCSHIVTN